jgi:hypothetical protein
MTETIREIHRTELLSQWIGSTGNAVAALVGFLRFLEGCQNGDGGDLEVEIDKLDAAGLGEWAEWGTDQDLDELAEVLATPSD